ncbi:MAG: hypothetical protein L3K23_08825 [Thermoplasmata archaeon]|nr:hypothetical protein [Thermoplasmata archaeon]
MKTREIVCSLCRQPFEVGFEVDEGHADTWICASHAPDSIRLDLLAFIKRRIAVHRTLYENAGRMVLRELVQNADDAGASILVLRFESDALYVANDGRAFTTGPRAGESSDFRRVTWILEPHKAAELDTTGQFGTGFQTVYVLTDAPEIHSNGWSLRMDPAAGKTRTLQTAGEGRLVSPYAWREESDRGGVLFRLPWREPDFDSTAAGTGGSLGSTADFPPYSVPERERLYNDLCEYLVDVVLCCQNLRTVRLIWAGSRPFKSAQVRRDFRLKGEYGVKVGTVTLGDLQGDDTWYTWRNRNDASSRDGSQSYQTEGWKWAGKATSHRFLVSSSAVGWEAGRPDFIGLRLKDGAPAITSSVEDLRRELKRNDVHLLLPMFRRRTESPGEGRSLLYNALPLPTQSSNWFSFTGRFFPDESRLDIDVASYDGLAGEWHRRIVLTVGRLFLEVFPEFVRRIKADSSIPPEVQQQIILDSLPMAPLGRWMRSKEVDVSWASKADAEIINLVKAQEILLCERRWYAPVAAIDTSDFGPDHDGASEALKLLGVPAYSREFLAHPSFQILAPNLLSRRLTTDSFVALFETFLRQSGGTLYYQRAPKGSHAIGKVGVSSLVRFCLLRSDAASRLRGLPVVPGKDGLLRPIRDYISIPEEFSDLNTLLTPQMKIHPDFEPDLIQVDAASRLAHSDRIPEIISRISATSGSVNFEPDESALGVISHVLARLAKDGELTLTKLHVSWKFIPVRYQGKIHLSAPNIEVRVDRAPGVFIGRVEKYRREFIFQRQQDRPPWLTDALKEKVRFLETVGISEEEESKLAEALGLIRLQDGPVPTSFVRCFLAPRGQSLFDDAHLSVFLGLKARSDLDAQKRAYLSALREYYAAGPGTEQGLRPQDWSSTPCLFDTEGRWEPPPRFSLARTPELAMFGYRELHSFFSDWPEATLRGIGVPAGPTPSQVVEVIRRALGAGNPDRRALADIFAFLCTSREAPSALGDDLRRYRWVPTKDGRLVSTEEVLPPIPETVAVLGPAFPLLFDLDACSEAFRSSFLHLDPARRIARLQSLGVSETPNLEQLLRLVQQLAKDGLVPPPGLLSRMESLSRTDVETDLRGGLFFWKGAWIEGHKVILSDDSRLRQALDGVATVIDPLAAEPYRTYLSRAGARIAPEPGELVSAIVSHSASMGEAVRNRSTSLLLLWDGLEALLSEGWKGMLDVPPPESLIYPLGDQLPKVAQLVIDVDPQSETRLFRRAGWIGPTFVFTISSQALHDRALRRLGARTERQLRGKEVAGILSGVALESRVLGIEDQETVLRLLQHVAQIEPSFQFGDAPVWLARGPDGAVLVPLSNCFLSDTPDALLFSPEVNLLVDRFEGSPYSGVRVLALAQRPPCKSLAASIVRRGFRPVRSYEDSEARERLPAIADALTELSPSWSKSHSAPLDRLRSGRLFRADSIAIELTLGAITRQSTAPCAIRTREGTGEIFIVSGDPTLGQALSAELAPFLEGGESAERGTAGGASRTPFAWNPPGAAQLMGLSSVLDVLLITDPTQWHILIAGLSPRATSMPPLSAGFLEEREEGYTETRASLHRMYEVCQICGRSTPMDVASGATSETVKRILSMKGGRYRGDVGPYQLANALYLCPSHQTLYERGLIRLPDIDDLVTSGEPNKGSHVRRAAHLREMAGQSAASRLRVEVFEYVRPGDEEEDRGPAQTKRKAAWRPSTIELHDDHAKAVLSMLADWLEGNYRA